MEKSYDKPEDEGGLNALRVVWFESRYGIGIRNQFSVVGG